MKNTHTKIVLNSDQLPSLFRIIENSISGSMLLSIEISLPGSFIVRATHANLKAETSKTSEEWNIYFVEVDWKLVSDTGVVISGEMDEYKMKLMSGSNIERFLLNKDNVEMKMNNGYSLSASLEYSQEDNTFQPFLITYRGLWTIGLEDSGSWTLKLRN